MTPIRANIVATFENRPLSALTGTLATPARSRREPGRRWRRCCRCIPSDGSPGRSRNSIPTGDRPDAYVAVKHVPTFIGSVRRAAAGEGRHARYQGALPGERAINLRAKTRGITPYLWVPPGRGRGERVGGSAGHCGTASGGESI